MHFFEGSEKKLEVVVNGSQLNLLELPRNFWSGLVESCNAEIISEIGNGQTTAYLLSESSLFVMKDRFIMITCGETVLINSIISFLEKIGTSPVELVVFQRKNEYKSHRQKTSFGEDVEKLNKLMPGKAYRMGDLDGHHSFIFHTSKEFDAPSNDFTNELLMYHITGDAADILRSKEAGIGDIRKLLNLETKFKEFKFDDYKFDPFGYSLNAIHGDKYITVHITPEKDNSYVSFETNIDFRDYDFNPLGSLLNVLRPNTFDHVGFNLIDTSFAEDYMLTKKSKIDLSCGYEMAFGHYINAKDVNRKPVQIL